MDNVPFYYEKGGGNLSPLYWLLAVGVLLVLEMLTLGLTTIWFAGGAFVAFLASLCHASVPVQIICFLAVSIILLVFTRPIAEKYFNKNREKTNVDSLSGQQGRVLEEINGFLQTGKVLLNGMEWSAVSKQPEDILPVDTEVVVVRVEGAHLVVKKAQEEENHSV